MLPSRLTPFDTRRSADARFLPYPPYLWTGSCGPLLSSTLCSTMDLPSCASISFALLPISTPSPLTSASRHRNAQHLPLPSTPRRAGLAKASTCKNNAGVEQPRWTSPSTTFRLSSISSLYRIRGTLGTGTMLTSSAVRYVYLAVHMCMLRARQDNGDGELTSRRQRCQLLQADRVPYDWRGGCLCTWVAFAAA